MPKGTPARWPFLVGAVGHFIGAPVSTLYGILLGGLFFGSFFPLGRTDFIVLTSILFAAIVIHLFGAFGFWRNYGPGIGLATFVYGIVAGALLLAGTIIIGMTVVVGTVSTVGAILFFVGILSIGVLFILEGISFLVARHFTAMRGLSAAVGILFIVAGSLTASFFMAFVGFFLLIPTFILGGILMARAHVPVLPLAGVATAGETPPAAISPNLPQASAPACPRCRRPLTFVPATQRWYCSAEGFYP